METKKYGPFDINQILNYLPHRYPFLFVDKVLDVQVPFEAGKMKQVGTIVKGIKNATVNEPYFTGHFPDQPITPGVIQIETMAQVACFALYPWVTSGDEKMNPENGFSLRLAGVDKARFRKPVLPGDIMLVTAEVIKYRSPIWGFQCKVEVDGALATECEILASVIFGPQKQKGDAK